MPKHNLFLPAVILCLICLATTGLVALTYSITLDARNEQAVITANANRKLLFPEAADFAEIENIDPSSFAGLVDAYQVLDAGGNAQGYLVTAEYRGYGGDVQVLIAYGTDGKILRLKVLSNDETPGLGKKVESDSFLSQFVGQGAGQKFSIKPQESGSYIIDAVSGATISSRAVTEAANIATGFIEQIISEVK
ncbi:MAG TPA: hypothetical protein DD640_01435 [Clostridiales bacterium]|nr:hypothetical protein [Clostridiales bacterium]